MMKNPVNLVNLMKIPVQNKKGSLQKPPSLKTYIPKKIKIVTVFI